MSPHAAPQVTLAQQLAHGALEGAALEWPEGQRRAEPAGLARHGGAAGQVQGAGLRCVACGGGPGWARV